jgi:hypothetical protein
MTTYPLHVPTGDEPCMSQRERIACCMRLRRAPADLAEMHRATEDVMLVICGGLHLASDALLIRPAPVVVPLLSSWGNELDRIIIEYAGDAIAEVGAPHEAFTADDRAWVRDHAAGSLAEIERPRCGWSRSARRATCPTRRQGLGWHRCPWTNGSVAEGRR